MQLKCKKSVFSDDREGYELQIRIQIRQLSLSNFFNLNINQVITVYAVPISHFHILDQRPDETSLSIINAIISLPNSVLNLYHVTHHGDSICDNNSGNVNFSHSVRTNRPRSSISAEHHLSSYTPPAHIMVRSSHSMSEVSVLDYQSSNSDLAINGRQNGISSIDIHASNTSSNRSVHENIDQREEHYNLSSHGNIDSNALAPNALSILEHLTPFDSSEIQGQQSPSEEAKSKHTTNSHNLCVGNNNVSKSSKSSREQFHVLDFSRRKHPNRRRNQSTFNDFDALDCEAQSSNQQNIPAEEAKPDIEISQCTTSTTMNDQRNDFPAAASELLANGYNRHQIDRALGRFYQNRGHNNPTLEELRYIVVVENSETDDEST
ncbi:unnamed protein product [Mytilus coruscus]|uniref:Uncharacterized protein n=1 Tax=Mytilus coruscus TaxID=42192 RepID=A0A6J8CHC0_MYTCO|nr:unnamed protein product [Mytilus coruscus]